MTFMLATTGGVAVILWGMASKRAWAVLAGGLVQAAVAIGLVLAHG